MLNINNLNQLKFGGYKMDANINNQNIDNFLNNIKHTTEYFNLTTDELLEIRNEYEYTREECKLFDDGLKIVFFDNVEELKAEKQEFESYMKSRKFEIKDIVKTVNERLVIILI